MLICVDHSPDTWTRNYFYIHDTESDSKVEQSPNFHSIIQSFVFLRRNKYYFKILEQNKYIPINFMIYAFLNTPFKFSSTPTLQSLDPPEIKLSANSVH